MFLTLFFATLAFPFEASFDFKDFASANQAESYLRFHLDTKKLGLFSSTVEGLAKKFTATAEMDGGLVKSAVVSFLAKDLSTDLYARDDQMWNLCLDYKKFEKVEIRIGSAKLTETPTEVEGRMNIRGKEKPIKIRLGMKRSGDFTVVEGTANLSFKDLEIPDPSIGIANVYDPIQVKFRIEGK